VHDDAQPPNARSRPTLRTIAERTGLHVSSVSRALQRPPDADESAAAVHAAALELGYRPDAAAVTLRTRRTKVIGMLVHALTDVVQAILYEEVERVAAERGYQAVVASTHDDPAIQRARVELLLRQRVDGLILADAHRDGEYVDWVSGLDVPYVLVMRSAGEHPAVVCDDELGGRLAAGHLLRTGHERVGLLTGPVFSSASFGRAEGFRRAMAEAGRPLAEDHQAHAGIFAEGGRDAMDALLDRDPGITAVATINDYVALGALSVLRRRGRSDVHVVGYNDIVAAEAVGLTTVRSPQLELARRAAGSLLDAIEGERPAQGAVLVPELVVRDT
jgi:LacI family transcriptional regulator